VFSFVADFPLFDIKLSVLVDKICGYFCFICLLIF